MSFTVLFAQAYNRKSLLRIVKADREGIHDAIHEKLGTAPHIFGKPLRQSLHGYWSLRVGKYRIIYRIVGEDVLIFDIGHRATVYKPQ